MQKSEKIFVGLLLAMVLGIPGVMAATTLNVPVTGTNYTTLTVSCTSDGYSSNITYNVSIYYNSTNGTADATSGTLLTTITNTSEDQTVFTASPSIESLADGVLYNFSCYFDNVSDQVWSAGVEQVGIDNTDPTYTFVLTKPSRADYKGTQYLTWTTADATSGVETVAVTVTSPNSDTCPTQSWSDTSGSSIDVILNCVGTYTAAMTVTDNAGNSVTTTDDFKVYTSGYKESTDGGISFDLFSLGGEGDATGNLKTFAIIAIIILIIWAIVKKK